MKLRYLFLGLMGAVLFTACSNDDTPTVLGDIDAYLSIGVTDGLANTKADTDNGTAAEQRIEHLTAVVFSTSGQLITIKDTAAQAGGHIDRIGHIKVRIKDYPTSAMSSETNFKVVLIANSKDEVSAATSLTDLGTKTTQSITAYDFANSPILPMASEIITVTGIVKDMENWITNSGSVVPGTHGSLDDANIPGGYTNWIELTRLNARVELEALSTDFRDGAYEGATFTLDSIFLVNVRENSRFTDIKSSVENTAAGFYGGMNPFIPHEGYVDPANTPRPDILGKEYTGVTIEAGDDYDFTPGTGHDNMFVSYMFENGGPADFTTPRYTTRLIIAGRIESATGAVLGRRYYHIELKDITKNPIEYVKPNTIYRINATLTGTGSPELDSIPPNAGIAARVTLKDWYLIEQNATGEESNTK